MDVELFGILVGCIIAVFIG